MAFSLSTRFFYSWKSFSHELVARVGIRFGGESFCAELMYLGFGMGGHGGMVSNTSHWSISRIIPSCERVNVSLGSLLVTFRLQETEYMRAFATWSRQVCI